MLTIERRLLISSALSPTDVSSANNLHNPSISSAMSLINIKNTREAMVDPWRNPAFKFSFNEMGVFDNNLLFSVRDVTLYPPEKTTFNAIRF